MTSCISKIKEYKPKPLKPYTNYKNGEYTFIDDNKTFKIRIDIEDLDGGYDVEAIVWRIKCKGCVTFKHGNKEMEISADMNNESIQVLYVYLGDAKGQRFCTKAVAYLIHALLIEAKKRGKYPYKGKVHLQSETFCAAANCYLHAFMINGFEIDDKNINGFNDKVTRAKNRDRKLVSFVFKFINKAQREKYNAAIKVNTTQGEGYKTIKF